MILSQLSKRERMLFIVTVSVVVSAGIINFVILPLGNKWRRLNSAVFAANTKLRKYVIIFKQKNLIERKYQLYAAYLKIKSSNEEAQATVLQEVENLARKTGVVLTNIVPSNLEDKNFYRQFVVRIELESNILSLGRYLYEIQKSRQLLGVQRLSIGTKSGEVLRCSLELTKIFIP